MKSILSPLFLSFYLFLSNDTSILELIRNSGAVLALIGAILAVFNQVYNTKSKVIENHEGSYKKWFFSFFKGYNKKRRKNEN